MPVSNENIPAKALFKTADQQDLSSVCMEALQIAFNICKVHLPDDLEKIPEVMTSCGSVNININNGQLWMHLGNQVIHFK